MRNGAIGSACLNIFLAMVLSLPIAAFGENKTLVLDSTDIKSMRIDTGAGELRVEGTASGQKIEVFADIHGDERDWELTLEKRGTEAVLTCRLDGWDLWHFLGQYDYVDLKVKVPAGLSLDIKDGSGGISLNGVAANTRIDDGSGSMEIRNHRGNVDIDDGSGGISIRDVVGNVEVDDGSGSIEIANIDGHVSIDDGSGSISVDTVKQGLTLYDTGSGSVITRNIQNGIDRRD